MSRKNNLDCQDDLDDLKEEYGLSNLTRILNSKKEPTTIVEAEVNCESNLVRLVREGIYMNYFHHKVSMWTFKAMICYKCQMPGHMSKNCQPDNKQVCKHCGGEHSFKDCITRKIKDYIFCQACNLKNDHQSGDKKCPKMINNFNKRNQSYASIAAKNNINPISKNETYRLTSKTATFPHSSSRVTEKIGNSADQDERLQMKFIHCIQDFFVNQTRIQESFQRKDPSKVVELFKRHFKASIVDKCRNYINKTLKNEEFYEEGSNKDKTNSSSFKTLHQSDELILLSNTAGNEANNNDQMIDIVEIETPHQKNLSNLMENINSKAIITQDAYETENTTLNQLNISTVALSENTDNIYPSTSSLEAQTSTQTME